MDDYSVIVEGEWGPEQAKSVKNKLQIYFQSKKKSQGGDCVVQYDDKSNFATILFQSSDSRDGVLSKAEHIIIIDSQKIKLKVNKPSTGQKTEQACGNQDPSRDGVISQKQAGGYEEPKDQSSPQTNVDLKKSQESSAVVLENLPDNFKQEVLILLVENISSLSEYDFSMELIPEIRKAVVTFKNPSGKLLYSSKNILYTTPIPRFHGTFCEMP
ncbi:protein mono-ADP-ribosyltransferase PARP14-like [Labeo rohita]|uniref:protein mono-ADP-ribosyltransferase PARP14-like n=1 Tax=Labeo rohita TaxID=84645 RepID=UPI0021E28D77|nr:protein mono-ADP-ribosyltransferase PARP14-like [Labeo rohita]